MSMARNLRLAAYLNKVSVRPASSVRIQIDKFQEFKTLVAPSSKPLLTVCLIGFPLQVVNCHSKATVSTCFVLITS